MDIKFRSSYGPSKLSTPTSGNSTFQKKLTNLEIQDDLAYPTRINVDQKCGLKQSALLKLNKTILKSGGIDKYQPKAFYPRKYAIKGIKQTDVIQLKRIFDSLDSTGAGSLTPRDIHKLLYRFGYNATKETLYQIIAQYDQDENGGIDFDEFMKIMTNKPAQKQKRSELKKVYRKFDKKNKGFVNLQDMKQICIQLNEDLTQAQMTHILRKVDTDKDGKFTFQDFYNVMHKMTYYK